MCADRHILINGLSIGSGGGYTVGRELLHHMALGRPNWRFTIALITGAPLHEQMKQESLPENCHLMWAPFSATRRLPRVKFENVEMIRWANTHGVNVVVQLNGMIIPKMNLPSLSHFQNPWPFRPEAWSRMKDRILAMMQRRENARALRQAACVGFTSQYLRDLICGGLGIEPRRGAVFYNGLPDSWIERSLSELPPWQSRALEIVTVSDVSVYKRQSLVIETLPLLARRAGLEGVVYRIIGQCPPNYRNHLKALAGRLGVADRVHIEGRVSDERVQEALRQARCFVLMSVCESFGIPAIEAMTFGTPVVVADCCAMPEVCGEAADLCPVDDREQLAGALARVLTESDHTEVLRRRGAERVARFSWGRSAGAMAQSISEIAVGS